MCVVAVVPTNDPIKRESGGSFFLYYIIILMQYIRASWQRSVVVMETPNQAWVARVQLRRPLPLAMGVISYALKPTQHPPSYFTPQKKTGKPQCIAIDVLNSPFSFLVSTSSVHRDLRVDNFRLLYYYFNDIIRLAACPIVRVLPTRSRNQNDPSLNNIQRAEGVCQVHRTRAQHKFDCLHVIISIVQMSVCAVVY